MPTGDDAGGLAPFGVQQTGQLKIAYRDKAGAAAILDSCADRQDKAAAAARKRRWKLQELGKKRPAQSRPRVSGEDA